MSSLGDLLRAHSDLTDDEVQHLHRLVGEWQILADLGFADLLMFVPDTRSGGTQWVCVAQVRPSTASTIYEDDLFSARLPVGERQGLDRAHADARIVRDGEPVWHDDQPVREEAIPVRGVPDGRVLAVLARDIDVAALRSPSALELAYLACANDLAQMIVTAQFPYPMAADTAAEAPRVGDGLLHLDESRTVLYASPNAQSALRRLGWSGNASGQDVVTGLAATGAASEVLGQPQSSLEAALVDRIPVEAELTASDGDAALRLRALPLAAGGTLVLLRDVTEVRRRDRALVTKDATIREIHHRVKNNLQTVAALLRLQARRTDGDARFALEESVRRVTSIAVVHETLSQALDELVSFDGIADTIASLSVDLATTEGGRSVVRREGSFRVLPAEVATPLALVLSELVSNAVEHAYGGGGGPVRVRVARDPSGLTMTVADSGPGIPDGDTATAGLGLQIVRSLVEGELRGGFSLRSGLDGGAEAVVTVPRALLVGERLAAG